MTIFKEIFTLMFYNDILEYSIVRDYNTYIGFRYILHYKSKYYIYSNNVKYWGYTFGLKKYNMQFNSEEDAIKFAKEHPLYGNVAEWEYNSRTAAYNNYEKNKKKYKYGRKNSNRIS